MDERILDNKYIINNIIGTGGMSIVYSGFSMDTGDEVAIKILRPEYIEDEEFIRRFQKELKITRQLRHKNIISTIDTGEDEGLPYIVMEYIKGTTLKELITQRGKLTNQEAVNIAVKICDALFYAHSRKLVHRDIKPQNVLIKRDGTVKVADFGIARMQDSGTITLGGSNILGSVHYISPEQARGLHITEKADIYSLGIVLYEMLTGKVPYEGDVPVSVALKHLQETPIPPRLENPRISAALEEVLLKAMSKEPEARYDNAFEFGLDLKRAIENPEGSFVKRRLVTGDTQVNIPTISREMEIAAMAARAKQNAYKDPNQPAKSYDRSRRKKSATYSILRIMIALVVIVGMIVTMFLIGNSLLNNEKQRPMHEVPRVMGQSDETAQDMIRNAGFKAELFYEYHQLVAESVVIRQEPMPDEMLKEGSNVKITISLGVQTVIVPDVINRNYSEAAILIEKIGLKVGDVIITISDGPSDYVLEQNPQPDEEIAIGEVIHLKISKKEEDIKIKMPKVLYLSEIQAQDLITAIGYEISQIVEINGNEQKGTIIKQEPEEEAILNDESVITLWASNGQGAQYVKEHTLLLSITEDKTHVIIEFIDGDKKIRYYDNTHDKGDYEITINLTSDTWGEKELYVYFNGEAYSNDRIKFEVEDG